jgi:predicted transcriptional regulator
LKNISLESKVGSTVNMPIGIRTEEDAKIMTSNKIKTIPLTEDGRSVAMVTARDLVEAFIVE